MNQHIPVLLEQTVEVLNPKTGEVFLDATAGYGGHSDAILEHIGTRGSAYLIDQDNDALTALHERFSGDKRVHIVRSNFRSITEGEIPKVDMILMDLGVSSPQLDDHTRGFSFRTEAPLDMRMDQSKSLTAADLIAELPEEKLAQIIWEFGEERQSRRIAHEIVQRRKFEAIRTTTQLASIVERVKPRRGRIHPATQTFQAIRIALNDEIEALRQSLNQFEQMLSPGGRWAVISFHSLEDRIVKQYFNQLTTPEKDWRGQIVLDSPFRKVTKKAIKGDEHDINPRARSAKLRAVEKIK